MQSAVRSPQRRWRARQPRHGWKAQALGLVLVLLIVPAPAAEALAQDGAPPEYRQWLYAAVGGLILGSSMLLMDEDDSRCGTHQCMVPVASVTGGTIGFLIGRERDRVVSRRYAGGPTLSFRRQTIDLAGLLPETITLYPGGTLAVGREGFAVVGSDRIASRRGGEIRGINSALAIPEHNTILAATASGVYAFPLRGDEGMQGRLVSREGAASLAHMGGSQLLAGGREVMRSMRLSGSGSQVQLQEETRITSSGTFSSVTYSRFSGIAYALVGNEIRALSGSSLEELGRLELPATGRMLSVSGNHALVTAGGAGLFLVDVSQPESLRLLSQMGEAHYAFSGAVSDTKAFIAAGRSGLVVMDITTPESPEMVGIARNLGLVGDVRVSPEGEVLVLDRDNRRMVKVELVQHEGGPIRR